MFRLIILSLLLAVVTYFNHSGGDKTPLREPSLVKLNMHLTQPRTHSAPSSLNASGITLQDGTLSFSSVEFLGSRRDKSEFHFTSSLSQPYHLQADITHVSLVEFDVPAGRYRSAKIILHATQQDSLPAMTVHALLQGKHDKKPVPLEIRFFDFPQVLSLPIHTQEKEGLLVFPRQGFSNLQIRIDPMQLFDPGMMDQLREATMQVTPSGRKVILSREHNAHIHTRLAGNVHQSIQALLKQGPNRL